ncbi:NPCBM/NEW2 domain-containing protein [Planctomicrobium piriforme]|uniref:NPCBM/NEW2 domain-containing protein n=1 Tax=Planctomicrobium piriforme TaxID=1576369 RepID=A0A1I3CCT7_9PLAN|nr:NPCBM/NEW2 domain-containing protein [Planctomicrobium piriforme]SFH72374.1 NPCBM/NEW2 domain-containing protein [Planctomicrobium piriforme]
MRQAWCAAVLKCFLAIACVAVFSVVWSCDAKAGAPATVTLLDGTTQSGELTGLNSQEIQLQTAQGTQQFAADSVMQLEFTGTTASEESKSFTGVCVDQSQLQLTSLTSDGTTASLETPTLGKLNIPIRQFVDFRLAPLDDKVAASWQDLRTRNSRDDLLVIRKGDVLDYVAGSVGRITPEAVTVLVRGKELNAPRDRIFGIVFAAPAAATGGRRVAAKTSAGDVLQADSFNLNENTLEVASTSLGKLEVPLDQIASLDFGGGRIRFLSDLAFDSSASKSPDPQEPVVWFVSKNSPAGAGGKGVLKIGNKEYRRGLWLHSGAVLRYRLNREYTRLRATAGFELTHVTRMPRFDPKVRLVITGDGKTLLTRDFNWNEPSVPLDVDLADVRELTIQVESLGAGHGILEHFALGDAQVIQ